MTTEDPKEPRTTVLDAFEVAAPAVSQGDLAPTDAPILSGAFDAGAALKAFMGATDANKDLPPLEPLNLDSRDFKRVVVLFHGQQAQLGTLRAQLNAAQEKLFEQFGEGALKIKLGWMLDNIVNFSHWSDKPRDVGERTSRAHCVQGRSDYGNAFGSGGAPRGVSAENINLVDANPDDRVDAVLVVGDRFDEDAKALAENMVLLKNQGTKVFFCDHGQSPQAGAAFAGLAAANGGVYTKVKGAESIGDILPAVVDYLKNGDAATRRMLASPVEDVKAIGEQLRLPAPEAPKP